MHYHKCDAPLANFEKTGARCGQIVGVADGESCEDCKTEQSCSLHHPDPEFHVDPTPPLKR